MLDWTLLLALFAPAFIQPPKWFTREAAKFFKLVLKNLKENAAEKIAKAIFRFVLIVIAYLFYLFVGPAGASQH
ncbi:MAG: hypothetical protein ACREEE_19030 [Dongiaceae bacterium]